VGSRPEYIIAQGKGDVETRQRGYKAMNQLLGLRPRPDGVFCFNDPMAMGAMHGLFEQGLRIPEDVALIGCGNLYRDENLRVPLSSVDQSSSLIGKEAARIALHILNSKLPPASENVILKPQLIVRGSTRRS
jgi:LacI family transcriptional regulator